MVQKIIDLNEDFYNKEDIDQYMDLFIDVFSNDLTEDINTPE